MAKAQRQRPIHLTNKTAVGLRKTAQRVRGAWLIAMCVMAMLTVVLAVYLGMLYLPAAPLTMLGGGAVIAVMLIASRSQYLMLISQAICTEAAMRQMADQRSEQERRRRAIEELAAMRADLREAGRPDEDRTEASLLFDLLTGRDAPEADAPRSRSEEDDELYAAPRRQAPADDGEDEDLHAAKPRRTPAAARSESRAAGDTQVIVRRTPIATSPYAPAAQPAQQAQTDAAPQRRRRRAAQEQPQPSTTPLKIIRGEQAK